MAMFDLPRVWQWLIRKALTENERGIAHDIGWAFYMRNKPRYRPDECLHLANAYAVVRKMMGIAPNGQMILI